MGDSIFGRSKVEDFGPGNQTTRYRKHHYQQSNFHLTNKLILKFKKNLTSNSIKLALNGMTYPGQSIDMLKSTKFPDNKKIVKKSPITRNL